MYNLHFHSAMSAMKVLLVRHRQLFQSDAHKHRRYRAQDYVEIRMYGREEVVTQRWPDRR